MKTEAGIRLIENLRELAALRLNPLKLLLRQLNIDTFTIDQKYPESNLEFGNGKWRAFFHVHGTNPVFPDEYGHFHIFTLDDDAQDWTHVVALSMDFYGQPIHWFCTNHWVTAGGWYETDKMREMVHRNLAMESSSGLPGDWLFNLVDFYRDSIMDLLLQRDEIVRDSNDVQALLQDREVYMLSSQDIDLIRQITDTMDHTAAVN